MNKDRILALLAGLVFIMIMLFTYQEIPQQEIEVYTIYQIHQVYPVAEVLPPLKFKYEHLSEYDRRQIDCLARNMYHEAGFEPDDGILAVGMVTLNRVNSGKFPKTICEVVYQQSGKLYQFSWVRIKNRLTIIDHRVYNDILDLATDLYFNYPALVDVTNGALFFHADYINPNWKRHKTAHIGHHIFYR